MALALSRQGVPTLDRSTYASAAGLHRGGYILKEAGNGKPEIVVSHSFAAAYSFDAGRVEMTKQLMTDRAEAYFCGDDVLSIVDVSDGVDTTGHDNLASLGDGVVPIHAVGFRKDPEAAQLDLAVRTVQA